MAATSPDTGLFCTFHVGPLLMGIDVLQVQEVIKGRELTPVPLAHEAIQGLLNLRGDVVTAIDLRKRLKMENRPAGSPFMLLVVPFEGETIAFVADSVGEVTPVEIGGFEPPPATLSGERRELITGVYKLRQRLLHVLDAVKAAQVVP